MTLFDTALILAGALFTANWMRAMSRCVPELAPEAPEPRVTLVSVVEDVGPAAVPEWALVEAA